MSNHFTGFTPEMFLPTRFASSEAKAAFANNLIRFIEDGCPADRFTEHLYNRLSLTFGFIAHYDRRGFRDTYFDNAEDKVEFLRHIVRAPCYGDPKHTFSDAERAVKEHILNSNLVPRFEAVKRAEERGAQQAALSIPAAVDSAAQISLF